MWNYIVANIVYLLVHTALEHENIPPFFSKFNNTSYIIQGL